MTLHDSSRYLFFFFLSTAFEHQELKPQSSLAKSFSKREWGKLFPSNSILMMLIDSQVLATIYFFTALGAENGSKVFNFNQVSHKRHGSGFFRGETDKVHFPLSLSLHVEFAYSVEKLSELLINVCDVGGKNFPPCLTFFFLFLPASRAIRGWNLLHCAMSQCYPRKLQWQRKLGFLWQANLGGEFLVRRKVLRKQVVESRSH